MSAHGLRFSMFEFLSATEYIWKSRMLKIINGKDVVNLLYESGNGNNLFFGVRYKCWIYILRWCRARFSRNTISPFRGILFSILGEKMSTFFPWNFFPGIKCRHFPPGINISPPKLTFSRNNMSQRFPWPSHDVWNFWTAEKNDILFRKYWNFFHKIVTFFWFLCQGWFLKTGSKNFNNNFRK